MIEIDLLFTGINRHKHYQTMVFAFFLSSARSDEILEVGGIEGTMFNFSLN
jgi:hypothetical protein